MLMKKTTLCNQTEKPAALYKTNGDSVLYPKIYADLLICRKITHLVFICLILHKPICEVQDLPIQKSTG